MDGDNELMGNGNLFQMKKENNKQQPIFHPGTESRTRWEVDYCLLSSIKFFTSETAMMVKAVRTHTAMIPTAIKTIVVIVFYSLFILLILLKEATKNTVTTIRNNKPGNNKNNPSGSKYRLLKKIDDIPVISPIRNSEYILNNSISVLSRFSNLSFSSSIAQR